MLVVPSVDKLPRVDDEDLPVLRPLEEPRADELSLSSLSPEKACRYQAQFVYSGDSLKSVSPRVTIR